MSYPIPSGLNMPTRSIEYDVTTGKYKLAVFDADGNEDVLGNAYVSYIAADDAYKLYVNNPSEFFGQWEGMDPHLPGSPDRNAAEFHIRELLDYAEANDTAVQFIVWELLYYMDENHRKRSFPENIRWASATVASYIDEANKPLPKEASDDTQQER